MCLNRRFFSTSSLIEILEHSLRLKESFFLKRLVAFSHQMPEELTFHLASHRKKELALHFSYSTEVPLRSIYYVSKSVSRLGNTDDVFPKRTVSLFRMLFVPLGTDLLQHHRSLSKRDKHSKRTLGRGEPSSQGSYAAEHTCPTA